ncbi:MAG: hypothetical protein ACI4EG_00920 [Fusicatenibacter sp.]
MQAFFQSKWAVITVQTTPGAVQKTDLEGRPYFAQLFRVTPVQ